MTNMMKKTVSIYILISVFFISCKDAPIAENPVDVRVPVTLTSIDTSCLKISAYMLEGAWKPTPLCPLIGWKPFFAEVFVVIDTGEKLI